MLFFSLSLTDLTSILWMNNARYSRPPGPSNIYRPSESERLQAQQRNSRLRNIQEKRYSQHLDVKDEPRLKKASNDFNMYGRVKDEIHIENNENEDDDMDYEVNISKDHKASPFYDYNANTKSSIPDVYNDLVEEPSPVPRVMSPNSFLKSRGYPSSSYQDNLITENNIKDNNRNNNNIFAFQTTKKDVKSDEQNNVGSRTLRKLLGEPLPLPYLENDIKQNEYVGDHHMTILTKNKLDNKSKNFNDKFKRLVSQDKINVARRLKELKHNEYDNANDKESDITTYSVPSMNQLPKFGNEIRHYRSHSRSQAQDASFTSTQPSVQFSTDNHQDSLESIDSDNEVKINSIPDPLILLELQRTLDANGEKLDLIIAMLNNFTMEPHKKTITINRFYSKHMLIRTICTITLVLSIFCVYYYQYYIY